MKAMQMEEKGQALNVLREDTAEFIGRLDECLMREREREREASQA